MVPNRATHHIFSPGFLTVEIHHENLGTSRLQRRIQNPTKRLRWSFFAKIIMARHTRFDKDSNVKIVTQEFIDFGILNL